MLIKNYTNQSKTDVTKLQFRIFKGVNVHKSIIKGLFFGLLLSSCVHTLDKDVGLTESPYEDDKYFPVYDSHTKNYNVVQKFHTNFTLTTTLIDQEFADAFSERYERMYKEKHKLITTADKRAAYFVSIYSPERRVKKIQSKDMWNIYLKVGDKRLKPQLFKRVRPKEKWNQFFPTITFWSHEFLIVFELLKA